MLYLCVCMPPTLGV